jgi:hypothetical protein
MRVSCDWRRGKFAQDGVGKTVAPVQRFAEKSTRNEFLTLYSIVNEIDSALIVDTG